VNSGREYRAGAGALLFMKSQHLILKALMVKIREENTAAM